MALHVCEHLPIKWYVICLHTWGRTQVSVQPDRKHMQPELMRRKEETDRLQHRRFTERFYSEEREIYHTDGGTFVHDS
jgi:hypothetical protein